MEISLQIDEFFFDKNIKIPISRFFVILLSFKSSVNCSTLCFIMGQGFLQLQVRTDRIVGFFKVDSSFWLVHWVSDLLPQKPCFRLRQARRRLQAAARQDDGHPSPSKEIQNKKSREREELPHQHSTGFRERAGCRSKMATANQNWYFWPWFSIVWPVKIRMATLVTLI